VLTFAGRSGRRDRTAVDVDLGARKLAFLISGVLEGQHGLAGDWGVVVVWSS
jgi:hypothetical protein